MPKSLFLEALEIVTMSLGRWVSEVDVIIAKQTFRVVLYPVRRPRAKNSVSWSLVTPYFCLNIS